ncbi:hypothetical protein PM082_020038 [Marasmius tenuissimus]|nr:hypothetical protein PM082_020038 [Marasmius tenuissimus]
MTESMNTVAEITTYVQFPHGTIADFTSYLLLTLLNHDVLSPSFDLTLINVSLRHTRPLQSFSYVLFAVLFEKLEEGHKWTAMSLLKTNHDSTCTVSGLEIGVTAQLNR